MTTSNPAVKRVALIGARGHTGAELVKLLDAHPQLALVVASSRAAAGKPLGEVVPGLTGAGAGGADTAKLVVEDTAPAALAGVVKERGVDAVVLALPNGEAAAWVRDLSPSTAVVDLSADHRFDDAWVYGLPEHKRAALRGATRIANPGCYATGTQLALAPLLAMLDEKKPPHVFGVSGYSGAGTTPSPKNDPEVLRDNLVPYSLVDHTHEREVSRQLRRDVFFSPHVAPFFRGITLTISAPLAKSVTVAEVRERLRFRYASEALVRVVDGVPLVRDAAHRHDVTIGGVEVDPKGRRLVVVATLDNLLKGAATQAVQNLNLAMKLDELAGIPQAGTAQASAPGGAA